MLGAREQLDQTTTEGFFLTGIIHLLAISGMHVGILAFGFWWVARLSPLPRGATLFLAGALVVIYTLLTDAQPPVVRARARKRTIR
jgi:competence protein ComEC